MDDPGSTLGRHWTMMTTMLVWTLAALMVFLLFLALRGTRARPVKQDAEPAPRRFWISTLKVGLWVALLRVSILWYLSFREWTGTQSLSLLPLILTLYPEGLLAPTSTLTATHVWVFSGLLAVGSLTMTAVVALLVAAAHRRSSKISH